MMSNVPPWTAPVDLDSVVRHYLDLQIIGRSVDRSKPSTPSRIDGMLKVASQFGPSLSAFRSSDVAHCMGSSYAEQQLCGHSHSCSRRGALPQSPDAMSANVSLNLVRQSGHASSHTITRVVRRRVQPEHPLNSNFDCLQPWQGVSAMAVRNVVEPQSQGASELMCKDSAKKRPIWSDSAWFAGRLLKAKPQHCPISVRWRWLRARP